MNIGEIDDSQQAIPVDIRITKTNSTEPFIVKTVDVINGEVGIIKVSCLSGDANGNAMTGEVELRYKKSANGILTLGDIVSLSPTITDNELTGTSFTILKSNENIIIQITGIDDVIMAWRITIELKNISLISFINS